MNEQCSILDNRFYYPLPHRATLTRIVPISKNQCAVLTPHEYDLIYSRLNADYKIRADFLLQTAVRLEEAHWIAHHPECYKRDNSAIFLPHIPGHGKPRNINRSERAVLLSDPGCKAVELFFEKDVGLPTRQAMIMTLKRAAKEAGISDDSIMPKMFRKTFISWLILCIPEWQMKIASSAGHDLETMLGHYITFGFKREDVREIRERIKGWGEA